MGERVIDEGQPRGDLAALRRSRIGFVFQKSNLIPFLTAHENVRLALVLNDREGPETHARAQELLDYLGVGKRGAHFPEALSGGEQQRVAIARAIAKRPEVLLCDEPTGALDYATGKVVLDVIAQINQELGTTTVVITHNAAIAALADRVVYLADGRIQRIERNSRRLSTSQVHW
jgi:putative ABC transport system ATP-binding protein